MRRTLQAWRDVIHELSFSAQSVEDDLHFATVTWSCFEGLHFTHCSHWTWTEGGWFRFFLIFIHIVMYTYIHIYIYIYKYIYICLYLIIFVCMYTYIYIYLYIQWVAIETYMQSIVIFLAQAILFVPWTLGCCLSRPNCSRIQPNKSLMFNPYSHRKGVFEGPEGTPIAGWFLSWNTYVKTDDLVVPSWPRNPPYGYIVTS